MRVDWKKIFIIGLGFATVGIAWSLYNSFVAIFLDGFIKSSTLISLIMVIDNVFGVILQPLFGTMSDKTKNRFGRRMPYLLIGIPISAIFFSLIPFHTSLWTLIPLVIGMNFFMSIYRAPSVAMMPDVTPPDQRSKANGIINFMGGLGTAAALVAGGKLFDMNQHSPFLVGGALMLGAIVILYLFYKEPDEPYTGEYDEEMDSLSAKEQERLSDSPDEAMEEAHKIHQKHHRFNLIILLAAIFFWFCGYNGIETFFTLYAKENLGLTGGQATTMLAILAGCFLIFAIPAGYVGTWLGRKKTMVIGLLIIIASFMTMVFIPSVSLMRIVFAISGIAWALININSYPTVVELAPKSQTGKYTGFYYTASFSASILSPVLFGVISDLAGHKGYLFLYGGISFAIALVCLLLLKKGDTATQL